MRLALTLVFTAILSLAAPLRAQDPSLHMAALSGDTAALIRLIDGGADPNAADAYGSTPLTLAVTFGRDAAVRALLDAGADPDRPEAQGSSPLHLAAFFGRAAAAEALLNAGADARRRNGEGSSPYDIAAQPLSLDRAAYDKVAAALAPLGFAADPGSVDAGRQNIAMRLAALPVTPVAYHPAPGGLPVSEATSDRAFLDRLYSDASGLPNLKSLQVIEAGHIVAEAYFNGGSRSLADLSQSVGKSVISALVGLGIEDGCLHLDDTLATLLPEVGDSAKASITLEDLLTMRSGLPWEETDPALWAMLIKGDTLAMAGAFPLVTAPGEAFHYSNLTANLLAMITARQCGTDLREMAEARLFGPTSGTIGQWWQDEHGFRYPVLYLSPDAMARFGLLYLNDGEWQGRQVLPAAWVKASLAPHVPDARLRDEDGNRIARWFRDVTYGYQWWGARIGAHRVGFAWGHGGQLIVLLPDRDMVVVTTAEPFWNQHDAVAWRHERAVLNLVGSFVASLP